MLKASLKTWSHSIRSSRRSSKSNGSGSCKSDSIEEKVKLAELLAQEAFFEKCQQVENEAQRQRMQEKLARAMAKAQIFENLELVEEQELQGEILGNHQQSVHSRQTKKENSKVLHNQQEEDW